VTMVRVLRTHHDTGETRTRDTAIEVRRCSLVCVCSTSGHKHDFKNQDTQAADEVHVLVDFFYLLNDALDRAYYGL